jgi:hypothetical protein
LWRHLATKNFVWRIFPFTSHYNNNQHELIPSTLNNSMYVEQTNMATLPREMVEIVKSFNIQHRKNILTILRHILRQVLFLKRQIWKERCLKNEKFTDRQQIKDYVKERRNIQRLRANAEPEPNQRAPTRKKPPDKPPDTVDP